MYTAISITTLLPRMVLGLPGAGEAERLAALELSYREFCRRSRVWRERIEVENIPAETLGVPLLPSGAADDQAQVAEVKSLYLGSSPVTRRGGWALVAYDDGEKYLNFDALLVPAGDTWELRADCVIEPMAGATSGPPFVLADYAAGIVAGARAYLMRLPQQSYTDYEGALFEERTLRRELARAAIQGQQAAALPPMIISLPELVSDWTLPESEGTVRDLTDPAEMTYSEFMLAFRTLVKDLMQKGVV